ncbi:MAG: AgmX/PglI C-terminal domain-containing protein [Nannocystaceae bacterium]|nr:AgmX/PglI C-terminal domain-containing protein [Nannocystaceae bacterium]
MNPPVPTRSSSPVTIAFVGLAGAVAGSLAVWSALAPGTEALEVDHTCRCECVTETVATPVPAVSLADVVQPVSGTENGPVTRPSPPRIRQARPEIAGPLDRDIIRRIVRAHINEVRFCYDEGLALDPALSGRVSVQFTIGAAGKVLEADVASSTLSEVEDKDGVATCVAAAVKRWKFPRFEGEAAVVTYPFVLSPGN